MNKFVKRLSNEASFLLSNLNAQTHPNQTFREWVENPNRDSSKATQELLDAGLIKEINGVFSPTPAGVNYFKPIINPEVSDLIRQIKNVIPNNPKFGIIVESLSDTALVGLTYAIFGEIGRRGDPENPEVVAWWQEKINAFQQVLTDATPDSLWERQKAQNQFFGGETTARVVAKPKKTAKK